MFQNSEYERMTPAYKAKYDTMLEKILSLQLNFQMTGISFDDCSDLFLKILHDHPEIFWLRLNTSGRSKRSENALEFTTFLREGIRLENIPSMQAELENEVERLVENVRPLTLYARILYVHDYIVDHTSYTFTPNCYGAYGCLVEHQAVCAGYSCAFQLVLTRLRIPCGRTEGSKKDESSGETNHEWNYVLINNNYYYIDVTWDDPHFSGENEKYKTHEYFCLSERDLLRSHRIDRSTYYVPSCNSNRYNYYTYKGYYIGFYSFYAASNSIRTQMRNGGLYTLKFVNPEETRKAVEDLVNRQRIYELLKDVAGITYYVSKSGVILSIKTYSEDRPARSGGFTVISRTR